MVPSASEVRSRHLAGNTGCDDAFVVVLGVVLCSQFDGPTVKNMSARLSKLAAYGIIGKVRHIPRASVGMLGGMITSIAPTAV